METTRRSLLAGVAATARAFGCNASIGVVRGRRTRCSASTSDEFGNVAGLSVI